MIVESELLGEVSVEQDELITFPTGLLGFPACREFVLIPSEREGLYWLQSAEPSPLAFLLVDPFLARVMRDTPADVISLKLGINVTNSDSMRLRAFVAALNGVLGGLVATSVATGFAVAPDTSMAVSIIDSMKPFTPKP